ncbi:MAG: AAA family ATPase, partial [Chloroflexota bacterium]|nr:AAA family ATPase [Chloroflexota bacterium]
MQYNQPMSTIHLSFLGPPQFTRADAPVAVPSAKAVALLAYLATRATPPSREAVQALLWPESFADAARKNLRNTLWAIRKGLGEAALRGDDDRLALGDDVWVDLWTVEGRPGHIAYPLRAGGSRVGVLPPPDALAAAAAAYGGPFLDGLSFSDAPEFDLWLTSERERLEQTHLRTLAALVERRRAVGDWAGVTTLAARALALDPLLEPLARALIEAHVRQGDRATALRTYDTLRATLDRELGVTPLPATEALRAAILDGRLQPAAPLGVVAHLTPRPAAPGDAPTAPFVGRAAEQAMLDAERARAAAGTARVVLLTGEVGIGKSRLWHEWAATLPPELPVLELRCLAATQTLPLAPLTALFATDGPLGRLLAADSPVPPLWIGEIARLLPNLRAARPDLPAPPTLPPAEERHRLFEALVQCIEALGGRPLVLFGDDLHWADHATLDWLAYLVQRLRDQALLLVAAYRPEDEPPALLGLVAGWNRLGVAAPVALDRLTPGEAATLVQALGGDPALAQQAQTQSAGNPYFLLELVRATPGDVPPALAVLVRARLDRLPDTARQVLQAAAVLEPDLEFALLRQTAGRSEEETLDALDALLAAGILLERSGRYTFSHPFVAGVVQAGLSGARRAYLHRRAAEAREAAYAGRLAPVAGRLADDYAEAGNPSRAAHYADLAAEHALRLIAPTEAVGFYRRALALEPTPLRWIGLAQALVWQGDLSAARSAFAAAQLAYDAAGDRLGVARACLGQADTYLPVGRADLAADFAARSLSYLDGAADPEAHALAHFVLGAARVESEDTPDDAEAHLLEANRLATEHHLPAIAARSLFTLGNLRAMRGDTAGAVTAFRESIPLAQAAGDPFQEVLAVNNAAYNTLLHGDIPAAQELVATGLALAERRELRLPLQYLYSTQGEIALAAGQPAVAAEWFRRGLAEAEAQGNVRQAANYHANLGLAARAAGDPATARTELEAAYAAAAPLTAPYLQTQIDLWLTDLYHATGDRPAAQTALTRAAAHLARGAAPGLQPTAARLRTAL